MNLDTACGLKCDIDVKTGEKLSHEERYLRKINYLGGIDAVAPYIPFDIDLLAVLIKNDRALNTSMWKWDLASGFVCRGANCEFVGGGIWELYRKHGINSASKSEGVCILKEAARQLIKRRESHV